MSTFQNNKKLYFNFIILFILFKSANLDISLSFLSIFSDDFFSLKTLSGRIPYIRFSIHQPSGRIRTAKKSYSDIINILEKLQEKGAKERFILREKFREQDLQEVEQVWDMELDSVQALKQS